MNLEILDSYVRRLQDVLPALTPMLTKLHTLVLVNRQTNIFDPSYLGVPQNQTIPPIEETLPSTLRRILEQTRLPSLTTLRVDTRTLFRPAQYHWYSEYHWSWDYNWSWDHKGFRGLKSVSDPSTVLVKENLGNLRHLHVSSPEQILTLVTKATNVESLTIVGNSWADYMLSMRKVHLNSKSIRISEATIPFEVLCAIFRSFGPDVESIEFRNVALVDAGWDSALFNLMQIKSGSRLVRLHVVGCYHITAFYQTGTHPGVNGYLASLDAPFITVDESQRIKDHIALDALQNMMINNRQRAALLAADGVGSRLSEAL